MRTPKFYALAIISTALLGARCDADSAEHETVDSQQSLYVQNQPIPTFQWSLERHLLVPLYQARNQSVTTYSYVVNQFNGTIMWSCTSLGFPIPATTQLTNPQRVVYQGAVIPQPEPNGVFAPPPPPTPMAPGFCVPVRGAPWSPSTSRSMSAPSPARWRSTTGVWFPCRGDVQRCRSTRSVVVLSPHDE